MPGMNTMYDAGAAMLGAIGLFAGDSAVQVANNVFRRSRRPISALRTARTSGTVARATRSRTSRKAA